MKGHCNLVNCQICQREMSFGRIKSHIKARHAEISWDEYLIKFHQTLPLYAPCVICNDKIIYKYQTCSKKCHGILISQKIKGIAKPEGFGEKLSRATKGIKNIGKKGGFTGYKHSEKTKHSQSISMSNRIKENGGGFFTNHKHSDESIKKLSKIRKEWYAKGNEPWTKTHPHTPETIINIFKKRKINKLEQFFSDLLTENNIEHRLQFYLREGSVCKFYDFKIKGKKILIEVDGDFYHGNPKIKKHFFRLEENKLNDKFKTQLAESKGFKLLRFWERDIHEDSQSVIEQVKKIINE